MRLGSFDVVLLGLGMAVMALPAGVAAFEYRQIDEWAVSCSNGYGCAISYNPPGQQPISLGAIQWHRNVAPEAPLTLSLPYPQGLPASQNRDGVFTISIDGLEVFSVAVADLASDDSAGTYVASDTSLLPELFQRMEAGKEAEISYSASAGTMSARVALDGFANGARLVDELQGREGRTDALIAKGGEEPPDSAHVWEIERYDQLPDSVLRNLSDEASACYTDESHLEQADAFGYAGPSTTMMVLPCGASGAYNQPYQIYVGRGESFHRSEFPNFGDDGVTVLDVVYNVNFDMNNLKLISTYLGRGLGDCGLAHYWKIGSATTGNPLVLTQERAKSACDGSGSGPENWPMIWNAEQLRPKDSQN